MLKDWTVFEKTWIVMFSAINIYLYFALDDTLLGFISSFTGMLCVVLVAKGKIANYYFGIIQTSTYAYISYTYGLFGEAMLNGFFYLPIQFIGIYLWKKNQTSRSVKGEDVSAKRLSAKGWLIVTAISIVASLAYAEVLRVIGGQQVRIDSIAVVLSIIAQILMLKRFAEQWLLWIIVNGLSVVLWFVTLINTGGNDWSMLVMWIAFLFNSVYGYVNWIKLSKKQEANGENSSRAM
jgi:nicotinamide mononucleotide transporter